MVITASAGRSEAPSVHIIDDDEGFRVALGQLLISEGHNVRQFGAAEEFIKSGNARSPGCLVLDVCLPDVSGIDLQRRLIDSGILMPVVLMSGQGDIPTTVQGMKAGAVDFLPKPFDDQHLLNAVTSALSLDAENRAQEKEFADLKERVSSLSAREREVLSHVVEGQMNKQIAFKMAISEITVKIHRSNVMKKMGARSLAALVRMTEALRNRS